MNELSRAPFVRLLIPFLTGIALGISSPYAGFNFYFLPAIILTCSIAWLLAEKKISGFRTGYIFAVCSFLLLGFSGFQLSVFHTERLKKDHISMLPENEQIICMRLVSSCIEKEKAFKAIAEVEMIQKPGGWNKKTGKILVYLRKNPESGKIRYGDRLIAKGHITDIAKAPNPRMFDYRTYMANRNIHHQIYLQSSAWKFLEHDCGDPVISLCGKWRTKMLSLFKDNSISGKEYAVGSALLLGDEDKLDPDILSAYSEAGVLHVLSVSGLHVAIVYAVLNALLFFLNAFRWGSLIKAALLLAVIWLYAALTGLSPSVLRSVAMFSFVIIGKALNRHSNIYNTLAASAFLLLCIDPFLVMDVGFQLSYIAVAGIVAIHPVIYRKWEAPFWLADQAWTLICVSIAAQAATFPLALYYFHQFPNYFLLTNLFVIPLSSLVMYSGMALFALCFIPHLGDWTAWLFNGSLKLLNGSVGFSANLPYASWKGVFISIPEMILLYLLVVYLTSFLARPVIRYLYLFLFVFTLYALLQCRESYRQSRQAGFIVYAVPNSTAIDFVEGKTVETISDSSLGRHPSLAGFYVLPCRESIGTEKTKEHPAKQGVTLYGSKGKHLLLIRAAAFCPDEIVKTDYLVLSKGARLSEDDLLKKFRFRHLILDSSCSKKEIASWKRRFSRLKLDVWVVSERGAFVEEY